MSKTLSKKLRTRWDSLMETEGRKLGLSGCRAFLENKMVNDIFYEGKFNGRECIVKCSSKAPDSIVNEYEMSERLYKADPSVCARPFAYWRAPDRSAAFVVTQKLPGPSLHELLDRELNEESECSLACDLIRICQVLQREKVVWRDVIPQNFMLDDTGHLRLIDAQFAFLRENFHEDPYLSANWKYRRLIFAFHYSMSGRGWNDVAEIAAEFKKRCCSSAARGLISELDAMHDDAAFPCPLSGFEKIRMAYQHFKMKIQFLFSATAGKRASYAERLRRSCICLQEAK